jgi:endonuclease G
VALGAGAPALPPDAPPRNPPVPDSSDAARVADNCFRGLPVRLGDARHGPTEYVYRPGYVLQHSAGYLIPLWVCERATASEVPRSDFWSFLARNGKCFRPDRRLELGSAECSDYQRSGYQRGHLAPAGNQAAAAAKCDTFFLSNMAPQKAAFNTGPWRRVENRIKDRVRRTEADVYVISGPLFWDRDEEDVATADGRVTFHRIGRDRRVAAPTHFFKVVVWSEGGADRCSAVVLRAEGGSKPEARSVQWIERRTGFRFFPDLSDADRDLLGANSEAVTWLNRG